MDDWRKTKAQLIDELTLLRRRMTQLQTETSQRRSTRPNPDQFLTSERTEAALRESEAMPFENQDILFPASRYVNEYKVVARSANSDVSCWAQINSRTDGYIPRTVHKVPPQAAIAFRILILNTSKTTVKVTASKSKLVLKDGESLNAFEGENWPGGVIWLEPTIIEINGEDCSKNGLDSILLEQSDFCVLSVSFPAAQRFKEREAINYCKEILLPLTSLKSKGEIEVVLEFF